MKLMVYVVWVTMRPNIVEMIQLFGIHFNPTLRLDKTRMMFYQVSGWNRKHISNLRITPTVLGHALSQKAYNITILIYCNF